MSDQNPYNAPEQPKYGETAPTGQYPQPAQYTQPTERYPQPTAAQYDPYAVPPPQEYGQRTNTLAIIALVLGLTIPIGGIVTGHIALGQIRRTGEAGRGLALAGLIIGYAYTALVILAILAYVIFIVLIVGAAGMSHSTGYNFNT